MMVSWLLRFHLVTHAASDTTQELCFWTFKGEKLQFVFRNINPSDPDSAYVITMGINESGSYQSKLNTSTFFFHNPV